MKELFRAEKIKCDYWLEDYNLCIYQGEIVYIQCVAGKSPDNLSNIITGNKKPDTGRIFVEEERVNAYDSAFAASKGILEAFLTDDYGENGTVAEVLSPIEPIYHLFSRKKMIRRQQKLLEKEGISIAAETPVSKLGGIERKKLLLLKARLLNPRLVVMNISREVIEGKLAKELGSMVQKMNREGITFVILSCNYSVLSEYATRIQLLYLGRDAKEWTKEIPEAVFEQLKYGRFFARLGRQKELERHFIGLYDYEWDIQHSFWEYLSCVKESSGQIWNEFLGGEVPCEGTGYFKGTAVVPGNSQDMLFEDLSIGQNLTIAAAKRVNAEHGFFINRRIQRKMEEAYYASQKLVAGEKEIGKLNGLQKKILSIERLAILRPSILFLELPYYDVGFAQIGELRSYLAGLVKRNIKVVYFSKTRERMMLDCKIIIQTKDGKSAKIDTLS